jgi:hypothetical protein
MIFAFVDCELASGSRRGRLQLYSSGWSKAGCLGDGNRMSVGGALAHGAPLVARSKTCCVTSGNWNRRLVRIGHIDSRDLYSIFWGVMVV